MRTKTRRLAVGGVFAGLALTVMLCGGILPLATFAAPALAGIFLVPVAEEVFYRGLLFRYLSGRSRWLAYAVSITVFALVHVTGYIGSASALTLLLCFLQYLPAGYCLAWCYANTGTIITPILMHMIVNAYGISAMR